MLPRILAILLHLASFVLVGKLIFDGIVFDFWSTQWFFGVIGTLVMIGAGVALLFFAEEDGAYVALAFFGCVYAFATALIYVAWAFEHVSHTLPGSEFFGFLFLFLVSGTVASISLRAYSEIKNFGEIYLFPAWLTGFSNVGCILFVAYKYVFLQRDWFFWPFTGELLIIVIGAVSFLVTYTIGQNAKIEHAASLYDREPIR